MTIAASAISGILKRAGFKKAATRTDSWSSGFSVEGFERFVRVWFTDKDSKVADDKLAEIAELINNRVQKKYFAKVIGIGDNSAHVVEIVAYDETDPEQNEARKAEAQETLAAEHPAAPVIADVKKALRTYSQYDADLYGVGYQVERLGYQVERLEEDTRLVRVRYIETAYTTYETDRDQQIGQTLANYARVLRQAGFEFQVRDDEMSVIVAMPGEWDNVLTVETVETILRSTYPTYSTQGGGFVVRNDPKDNGALRVEYYNGIGNEQEAHDTVERYGRTLIRSRYDVTVDFQDAWSLLVKLPEKSALPEAAEVREDEEQVRQALLTLRDLAEADGLMYSTRSGGPDSLYIFAVNLNVLVFFSGGEYKTRGRHGRHELRRFPAVNSELLDFIRAELGV